MRKKDNTFENFPMRRKRKKNQMDGKNYQRRYNK